MKTTTGSLLKRGKVYHAVWYVNRRRFAKSTQCRNRRDAEKKLAEFMAPIVAGNDIESLQNIAARIEGRKGEMRRLEDERNPPLTVARAWIAYEADTGRPDSGEVTLGNYRSWWKAFAAWLEKDHPNIESLRDVTPEIASDYAVHLSKARGLSANSFNKHISFLTLLYRVLKKQIKGEANPFTDIKRKRNVSQSRRELTTAELRTVCEAAQGEMRTLFAIGIYTGLRLGDCATLQWSETDLERRIIRRIPNKTARRNPKPVLIPIHETLAAMLAETPPKSRKGHVLPEMAEAYRTDTSIMSKAIHDHFEACGVKTHRDGTGFETVQGPDGKPVRKRTGKRAVVDVGFHSLRHTFVSLCRESNAPLSVVEAIVGHSSPAMTRHYTHTGDEAAALAVNALPSVMGDTAPALPHSDPARELKARIVQLKSELDTNEWKRIKEEILIALD